MRDRLIAIAIVASWLCLAVVVAALVLDGLVAGIIAVFVILWVVLVASTSRSA